MKFVAAMSYFYFIFLVLFPVLSLRKILRSESSSSSAEILNSSIQNLDEFTLCGRIFSHQFSSVAQTFLHFLTDDDNDLNSVALGTFPGYPCDSFYQGYHISYYICHDNQIEILSLMSGCTSYMKTQLGNDYRRGNVYGTLFHPSGNVGDQFFEVWTLGIWHSFCITTSKNRGFLNLYIDGREEVKISNYTGFLMNSSPKIILLSDLLGTRPVM